MVRLLSRSRMVAIMPSIEGHAPASLTLRVLDGPILWLSDDAGEFARRDFHPVPWAEPDPWERGAKASIFRTPSRCEAEFQPARAENPGPQQPVPKPIMRWLRNLQSSTDRNTGIQSGRK